MRALHDLLRLLLQFPSRYCQRLHFRARCSSYATPRRCRRAAFAAVSAIYAFDTIADSFTRHLLRRQIRAAAGFCAFFRFAFLRLRPVHDSRHWPTPLSAARLSTTLATGILFAIDIDAFCAFFASYSFQNTGASYFHRPGFHFRIHCCSSPQAFCRASPEASVSIFAFSRRWPPGRQPPDTNFSRYIFFTLPVSLLKAAAIFAAVSQPEIEPLFSFMADYDI